jgi:hypothetical protein
MVAVSDILAGLPLAVREDPLTGDYKVVSLNGTNGVLTDLAVVPGMSVFVLGNKTCLNTDMGYYHFAGFNGSQQHYYTYDMINQTIISDIVFNDNIVGVRFNCNDSLYYGLREQSNSYDLVTFDPFSGSVASIGPVTGIDAYVGNAFALDRINSRYIFIALDAGNYYLNVYDIYSGALLYSSPFPDNLTGLRFNCPDTTVYALWEKGADYQLEVIDVASGTHSTRSVLAGVVPGIIPESSSVNNNGEYTYRGFDSNNMISLITIDLATGAVTNTIQTNDNATGFEEPVCCYGQGPPVGIDEYETGTDIHIYPNPCRESFVIRTGDRSDEMFIQVRNASGQLVFSGKADPSGITTIDASDFVSGTYLVEISGEDGDILLRDRIVISK